MKSFFKTLLKHPVSVSCSLLYTALCALVFMSNIRYNRWLAANPKGHYLSYGEGIMYGIFFLIMTGAVFGFVLIINAIVRKQPVFYLWLLLIIVVQAVAAIAVA